MGTAAGYWWQWNITMGIYKVMYLSLGVQKRCCGGHTELLAYTMRTRGQ